MEVSLYGVRLAGGLLLFFIGLQAPGIASVADYIPYQRDAAGTGANNVRRLPGFVDIYTQLDVMLSLSGCTH